MSYAATVLADNPVVYLPLDEAPGASAAIDLGSNATNWTYSSGVVLGNAPVLTTGGGGTSASAGASGIAQLASVPSGLSSWAGVTLEAWAYLPDVSQDGVLVFAFPNYGIGIGNTAASNPGNKLIGTGSLTAAYGLVGTGGVHLVVTVSSGGAVIAYANGVQIATGTKTVTAPTGGLQAGGLLVSGSWLTPLTPLVRVSQLAIYAGALSPTRVAAHYTAGAALAVSHGATSVKAAVRIAARANGATTITAHAAGTGPVLQGYTQPAAGITGVIVTAAVNGVRYTTTVSRGVTAATVSASGKLQGAAEADGTTTVTAGSAGQFLASAEADGVSTVMVIYTPAIFGDPGTDPSYDPDSDVPIPSSPPIQLGLDLGGTCSVVPPALALV